MGETLTKIDMHGLDVLVLYIKLYGAHTILIIFSLIDQDVIPVQLYPSSVFGAHIKLSFLEQLVALDLFVGPVQYPAIFFIDGASIPDFFPSEIIPVNFR